MTLMLGRFTTPDEPDGGSVRMRGDELQFESVLSASTFDEFQARLQQLRGLVDNGDENVFPFTWSEDPNMDGYYTDVDVDVRDSETMLATFNVPFSVRMRRIGGYSAPQFEWIVQQLLRTNPHGIAVGTGTQPGGVWAVPSSAVELSTGPGGGAGNFSRTSADGALTCVNTNSSVGTVNLASFYLPPANRYDGAAKIEVSYGGTFFPIVGSQIPANAVWRLSNGLIRVSLSGASLAVEPFDGTQWDPAGLFRIGGTTPGLATIIGTPRVLRNSPELVVLRCSVRLATGLTWGVQTLDLALFAGHRHIEGRLYSTAQATWYVEPVVATASTALTGGLRSTATDANTNRFLLAGAAAQTNDLAIGRLRNTAAANALDFMVGYEINIGTTAVPDTAQIVVNKYFQSIGTRQTVVTR